MKDACTTIQDDETASLQHGIQITDETVSSTESTEHLAVDRITWKETDIHTVVQTGDET